MPSHGPERIIDPGMEQPNACVADGCRQLHDPRHVPQRRRRWRRHPGRRRLGDFESQRKLRPTFWQSSAFRSEKIPALPDERRSEQHHRLGRQVVAHLFRPRNRFQEGLQLHRRTRRHLSIGRAEMPYPPGRVFDPRRIPVYPGPGLYGQRVRYYHHLGIADRHYKLISELDTKSLYLGSDRYLWVAGSMVVVDECLMLVLSVPIGRPLNQHTMHSFTIVTRWNNTGLARGLLAAPWFPQDVSKPRIISLSGCTNPAFL